jgi:uncharacterized protein (DUF1499 family)
MFAGQRPTNLGVRGGRLAACPSSPNCVSSQSEDALHKIEPIAYTISCDEAIAKIKAIIESEPKTQIITVAGDYLYAEFATLIMGFVDDVEFYFDDQAKLIHVRSASRLGKSDLGVNRKRIEKIRRLFNS